jgi:OPT family oligopeptide transporter
MRRFLVWPSSLLWPENLPSIILLRTLNDSLVDGWSIATSNETWGISRLKFFIIATIGQCIYFWIPNYFMRILLAFTWLCWIKPKTLIRSQLTGMNGFGIGSLNFDWTSITLFWQSPIIVPLWAKINILIGFVLIVWILSPLCFYTNILGLHFSPIRSSDILRSKGYFDHFNYYIDRQTYTLNETKYKLYVEKYGEVRLSVAIVLQFGLCFVLITSLIVHTILYHGHDILKQARTSISNRNNDIHCFLMSRYPETPEWWFTITFVIGLTGGILACYFGKLMPWYHVLSSIAVSWILILAHGIIRANTGFNVLNDSISFYIGSLIFHNKPLNLVTFHTYGSYLLIGAVYLLSNLKLCHYAKIPPRSLFILLVVGRLVTGIVGYVVGSYLLTNIHNVCQNNNVEWSCGKTHEQMGLAILFSSTGQGTIFN